MPFQTGPRGIVQSIQCHILSPDGSIRGEIEHSLKERIEQAFDNTVQTTMSWQNPGHERRLYILLIVETSGRCRLATDCLHDIRPQRANPKRRGAVPIPKSIGDLAKGLIADIQTELAVEDACLDKYLQDQLVVFQALLHGRATIRANPEPTLHTKTARWVAETVLKLEFDEYGQCAGINYESAGNTERSDCPI